MFSGQARVEVNRSGILASSHSASGSNSGEEDNVTFDPSALECQQLVLDVPEGTMVKLSRKENGRRSQLWRMTSTGRLQHEGSSPPHDPTSRKAANNAASLVLVLSLLPCLALLLSVIVDVVFFCACEEECVSVARIGKGE